MGTGVVDLHVDTLSELLAKGGDLRGPREDLQVDAPRCRAGGVNLLLTACFVGDTHPEPASAVDDMLALAAKLHDDAANPFRRITSPRDLEHGEDAGTRSIAFLLTIENARSLAGNVDRLASWHERGVRIVGLTWNGANELASGVDSSSDEGLTDLGRRAVQEAARLGMAIDLSHLAPRAVSEVLDQPVPVLATHSNARALCDHRRNLEDGQLRALAARDAVVGINFFPPFLVAEGPARLTDVARHAAHLAAVMGADRVALGCDLDGVSRLPEGFRGHQDLPLLDDALAAVGFSAPERAGIFSENFLRWWQRWATG